MKEMEKQKTKKTGIKTIIAAKASSKKLAGSCTGVKYPCSYHCKDCYYDDLYIHNSM